MEKNNTPFSLGYRFLTTIKHRYALQGFAFLFFALCNPLSMAAQAPNISYAGVAANYPLNAAIPMLTPNNSGGSVFGIYSAVTTFAGTGPGLADGPTIGASFNQPVGVAVDAVGNVYVADTENHKIRKITAAGVVSTFAGSGSQGSIDETGLTATFNGPTGVVVDASGNVYVADRGNSKIRKITAAGVVSTLAGSGLLGSTDAIGTAASFAYPQGVAVDASGNVYVSDGHKIRKITAAGVVTTFAGGGAGSSTDGIGTAASFNQPYGVAVDASGNVYVGDRFNNRIRKITAAGVVTTFAVSGIQWFETNLSNPQGVALDAGGNMYVTNGLNNIQKITSDGVVSTFAGSGRSGSTDAAGITASFNNPTGVTVDASGNVYVADLNNNIIRKITAAGVVTTFAGSGLVGSIDGPGSIATFFYPASVAVDALGNVYVIDRDNHKIRKITPAGVVSTFAGNTFGSTDGTGTAASFNTPAGVAVDASGNVYVADLNNNMIRKITAAGVVSTLAGSRTRGSTDGTGTAASFYYPAGVAVDVSGNVYVTDQNNHKIRKITAAGVVTTLAGSGTQGSTDGTGTAASFYEPKGVAVDALGNVYVADTRNNKIRKITAAGVVTTLASSGTGGDLAPSDVALDASGSMYVADRLHKIRKVSLVGFSINPALPTGLSINASGVISGTPTVGTVSKTYTITGVNLAGSNTTTITFGVGAIATKDVSEQLNTLTIKPTLAQDVVHIVLSDNKATTVRVFNIAGQQVLTTKAQGEQQMNISTLPSGLYIIRTATGKVGRFVKQ